MSDTELRPIPGDFGESIDNDLALSEKLREFLVWVNTQEQEDQLLSAMRRVISRALVLNHSIANNGEDDYIRAQKTLIEDAIKKLHIDPKLFDEIRLKNNSLTKLTADSSNREEILRGYSSIARDAELLMEIADKSESFPLMGTQEDVVRVSKHLNLVNQEKTGVMAIDGLIKEQFSSHVLRNTVGLTRATPQKITEGLGYIEGMLKAKMDYFNIFSNFGDTMVEKYPILST